MSNLQITNSRIATGCLLVCHGCALFALSLTDLGWLPTLALTCAVLVSLAYGLANRRVGSAERVQALTLAADHCVLHYTDQALTTAPPRLHYSSEYLLVLGFRPWAMFTGADKAGQVAAAEIRVLLLPDSLSEDDDRRLRCYLRFDLKEVRDTNNLT